MLSLVRRNTFAKRCLPEPAGGTEERCLMGFAAPFSKAEHITPTPMYPAFTGPLSWEPESFIPELGDPSLQCNDNRPSHPQPKPIANF